RRELLMMRRRNDEQSVHIKSFSRPQTIPMMIVAECNYYCLSALYIVCNKPGLKILINGYRKSL
ncbi:hypothetical protein, partial [Escherichia coli]